MGIDSESDVAADLVIGPTSAAMVRIYVQAEGVDLPMDFEPEEALEIAEELRAAAMAAQKTRRKQAGGQKRGVDAPGGRDKPKRPRKPR